VKGAEDGADLVVRAVETTGRPAHARLELPIVGRVIEADFGPSQLRTFRVPADGGAAREVDLIERDLPEPSGPFTAYDVD
jgi:alpha-mannosidase